METGGDLTAVSGVLRVSLAGMYITRPSLKVGRYKMIKHKLDKGNDVNPKRYSSPSEDNDPQIRFGERDICSGADEQAEVSHWLQLVTNV